MLWKESKNQPFTDNLAFLLIIKNRSNMHIITYVF